MLKKIHHVGVVVRSADEALRFFRDTLGLSVSKDAVIEDQGVRGVLLPVGDSEIELLEPTREGTGVARYLEKGEGMHHVCFESDDVAADLNAAKEKGQRLLDEKPRAGLAGMIGFLHPGASGGVLVEFATPPAGESHHGSGGMVRSLDHLAVAVKDLDAASQLWNTNYGFQETGRNDLPAMGIKNANLKVGSGHAFLELVTPTNEEGPVGKFVAERGGGMYLISLEVADLAQAVASLREKGVRVGDPMGSIAFVSPRSAHGVNIQLRAAG